MPNCVSLGRPLGGCPWGSPRTSMGWDMTHRGRHRSYEGRPRTPRGRPNRPADVHGTVDALWTQQTLFGLVSFYSRRVLQRKMCHECIILWHTCLSHENVANRMFSTRVLQTVSLVSRLDSRILIRLGALRYVTAMLLRRWAWLILSNPVTSSRIRPLTWTFSTGSYLKWVAVTWFKFQYCSNRRSYENPMRHCWHPMW